MGWRGDDSAVSQVIGFLFAGVIFMGLVTTLYYTVLDESPSGSDANDQSTGPWRAQAEAVLAKVLERDAAHKWRSASATGGQVDAAYVKSVLNSTAAYNDLLTTLQLPSGTQVRVEYEQTGSTSACRGVVAFGAATPGKDAGTAIAYRKWDGSTTINAYDWSTTPATLVTWPAGSTCQAQVTVKVFVYQ